MRTGKIIAVDLDDVLVERPKDQEHLGVEKYRLCTPIRHNIIKVNQWFDQGHTIIIYTARGMSQFEGNIELVEDALWNFTMFQMKDFGIKFHKLIMGKIHYDFIIDDKAVNSKEMLDLNVG